MEEWTCPTCGSTDTFFSAVSMSRKCNACGGTFERQKVQKKKEATSSSKSFMQTQIGEEYQKYLLLDRKTAKDGCVYTLWKTPAGTRFRVEQESPRSVLMESFKTEEEGRKRLAEIAN